jgi:hypothetical protein
MEEKQLQEDDVVFGISSGGDIMQKYLIDRVTKTMAFSGATKFKRVHNDGWIYTPGGCSWQWTYRLSNPKLKAEYVRLYMIRKVKNIKWDECSVETLKTVVDLVEKR